MQRSAPQKTAAPSCTLGGSRWHSVVVHSQVFTKNCINSSANKQQKGRRRMISQSVARFGDQIVRVRKTKSAIGLADRALAPFLGLRQRQLPLILAKQLALRELERTAGFGAAVRLALDDAGVAG